MKIRIALLLVLPILASCATSYEQLRKYDKPDAGTAVLSLGHANGNTMNYSHIWFKASNSEHLGYFEYSPKILVDPSPKDFVSERGEATLIAKKLPPGDYEITGFSTGSDYGKMIVTYSNPAPVAIRFNIRPSEVSYLGQYLIGLRAVPGDGKSRPVSARLDISNEQARDFAGSKSVSPVSGKSASYFPVAPLPLGVDLSR